MQFAVKLTARQQQILDLIRSTIERTGIPPTRAEIARALGFKSPNAAEDHLKALARKGAIELSAGTSRGIRMAANAATAAAAIPSPASLAEAARNLVLPLVGRVAAGSPILAAEHVTRLQRPPQPRKGWRCTRAEIGTRGRHFQGNLADCAPNSTVMLRQSCALLSGVTGERA